ncbi:ATP-binding cassette domain-containing protein [Thermocrinis sp.]|uniref:metal ABC transporter ATP-binding protein n=1 Tax=Thermocrinis sp. TaxID=2024383 RepID=UPI002FDEBB9C
MQEVIRVEKLRFRYKKEEPLIEDLSFSVYKGEFFCVVGPNGSGKTTLLKLLLGFLKPHQGRIYIFGEDLKSFNRWEKVGYVPQRFSVERFWTGTVEELFRKVAKKEKVGWIIAFLHLEGLLKKQFVKLSGGEQQKVLLALALTKNPDLLILDEPLTGLDIHAQEHIESTLREIAKDRTVVVVSHDIGFVLRNATRMLCLGMQECKITYPEQFTKLIRELYGLH